MKKILERNAKLAEGNASFLFLKYVAFIITLHFHLGQLLLQKKEKKRLSFQIFPPSSLFSSFFHTGETHKLISAIIVFGVERKIQFCRTQMIMLKLREGLLGGDK